MNATQIEEKETGRIEAFSDGVFAIAVTLLVLDLKVPQLSEDASGSMLQEALLRSWPSYAAYLISFLTILIMWVNHHRLFKLIRRSDSRFLFINGLLLLIITTIPFPTSLLAEYFQRPAAYVACAVYTGAYVVLALFYNALWRYASAGYRLLGSDVTPQQVRAISHSFLFGPALYMIAFVLAFVNVYASLGLSLLLAIFWAVAGFEVEPQ